MDLLSRHFYNFCSFDFFVLFISKGGNKMKNVSLLIYFKHIKVTNIVLQNYKDWKVKMKGPGTLHVNEK